VAPAFFLEPMIPREWYAYNFSDLNANALAFNTALSLDIRQAAADRMLAYPATLSGDPVLKFALEHLAERTPAGMALYYAALPLGEVHLQVLRLQDHWEILNYISQRPHLKPAVEEKPATLNWDSLIRQATYEYAKEVGANPFGISDIYWQWFNDLIMADRNDLSDDKFLEIMQTSLEWRDLDLLLKSLKELGAQPLLMTVPFHGKFYDFRGLSAEERATFYVMFRAAAKPYAIPVVTFEDHEYDTYFFLDTFDHPSPKGWVYYDRALDDFFHGRIR
jgi:D-alanine transfer protein